MPVTVQILPMPPLRPLGAQPQHLHPTEPRGPLEPGERKATSHQRIAQRRRRSHGKDDGAGLRADPATANASRDDPHIEPRNTAWAPRLQCSPTKPARCLHGPDANTGLLRDSGLRNNDSTTNQQIDAEDGRPLPAPLCDAGNRQHPAISVGTLKATVGNADIDLDIETRHTPSIGETLISAARLVDEKDCKIVLQSKDRGGSYIETNNSAKIPLDRDERGLFGLHLKPQTTADHHSGAGQTSLDAYQPSEPAKDEAP